MLQYNWVIKLEKVKNNLLQWRQKLGYKFAKDFAEYLDVGYVSYIQWETNTVQISLEKLIHIWKKLKTDHCPELNMEDLLDLRDDK